MSDSPGFPPVHGASRQFISAAWRGASPSATAFGGDEPRKDPHQAARLGRAAMAVETARLWVAQAATITGAPLGSRPPEQLVAYVNLARLAVEPAALDLMQLVQRSVGLQAFLRPNPIERISRDLATYLRQPGPDRARTDAATWILAQSLARPGFVAMTAGELLEAAHSFPFHPLREKLEDRPFIVVAPHPDDGRLACGGLIAEACRQGLGGRVVVMAPARIRIARPIRRID